MLLEKIAELQSNIRKILVEEGIGNPKVIMLLYTNLILIF